MQRQEQSSGTGSKFLLAGILGITAAVLAQFILRGEIISALGVGFAGLMVYNFIREIAEASVSRPLPQERAADIECSTDDFVVAAHLPLDDAQAFQEEMQAFRDDVAGMIEEHRPALRRVEVE